MSAAEKIAVGLLRKILWECEYIDMPREDRLVLDGSVEGITSEEKEWMDAFYEEMRPVAEAEELAYWQEAVAERVDLVLAGDTSARERLSYFAHQETGIPRRLAREALEKHGWEKFK